MPHIEKHFTVSETVRDVVIGSSRVSWQGIELVGHPIGLKRALGGAMSATDASASGLIFSPNAE